MAKLTIAIPTFNRKRQLQEQLVRFSYQDLTNVSEILIIDNNSNYCIDEIIPIELISKVRIIRNSINIGMSTNMQMPFLHCKSEWLWIMSDDDHVSSDGVEKVLTQILKNLDSNIGLIKFSIDRQFSRQENKLINSLVEYIDYYYCDSVLRRGDAVFISDCVYNLSVLKSHIISAFNFSYSYIGFLMPVLFSLDKFECKILFSSERIVNYVPPREGNYSFGKLAMGVSILSHINFNLSVKDRKRLMNLLMPFTYKHLISGILHGHNDCSNENLIIVYNNIYQYYLSFFERFLVKMFIRLSRYKKLLKCILFLISASGRIKVKRS